LISHNTYLSFSEITNSANLHKLCSITLTYFLYFYCPSLLFSLLFFTLFPLASSLLFLFSSSFFCCYYSSFSYFSLYCFLHSSGCLIIFTFSIFQSILGLWQASYKISRITFYFCPTIILIYILFLSMLFVKYIFFYYIFYWPLLVEYTIHIYYIY